MLGGRTFFPNAEFSSPGLFFAVFSFKTTNIGSNPSPADFYGCGGETGGAYQSGGAVSNSGPSFVESITKTANAGEFLVTYAVGAPKVWHADAEVFGPAAGPGDGVHAQACLPNNEGGGHTTKVTQLITVLDAAGAPVETAARRVSVLLVVKAIGTGP